MKNPRWISALIVCAVFTTSCSQRDQSSDAERSMNERAITTQPEQQHEIRRERADTAMQMPAYEATLTNSRKDPERETPAEGTVSLSLQDDSIHIKGRFSGLRSAYTGSAIHKVLESDTVQTLNPALSNNKRSGSWENSYQLNEEQVTALKSDSLYISVYSEEYESGEITGQITAVDSITVDSTGNNR